MHANVLTNVRRKGHLTLGYGNQRKKCDWTKTIIRTLRIERQRYYPCMPGKLEKLRKISPWIIQLHASFEAVSPQAFFVVRYHRLMFALYSKNNQIQLMHTSCCLPSVAESHIYVTYTSLRWHYQRCELCLQSRGNDVEILNLNLMTLSGLDSGKIKSSEDVLSVQLNWSP